MRLALIWALGVAVADAAEPALTGKDLASIVATTSTEGGDQQKYIGKAFADRALFWRATMSPEGPRVEVVTLDAHLHPSYVDAIYVVCPGKPGGGIAKLIVDKAPERDDKLTIKGVIADVVGDPTADEPNREIVLLKPGCEIRQGWP